EIIDATKNTQVLFKNLDLSSFTSIREFAADINKTEDKLDVLVHNAGYAETFKKNRSVDDIEMTMATNHYGPFMLTHLLIDLLKKSAPSRIVVVASLYRLASFNLDNPSPVDTLPGYLYLLRVQGSEHPVHERTCKKTRRLWSNSKLSPSRLDRHWYLEVGPRSVKLGPGPDYQRVLQDPEARLSDLDYVGS
ncbi:Retinol dehydrogenase 14, partial [Operophtera brumata]